LLKRSAISLWSVVKKKPIFTKFKAHGSETSSWICSLAAIPHSDVFCSGSNDGFIRLWKLSSSKKSFSPLLSIPMAGFINALQFTEIFDPLVKKKSIYLIAAIGQEHRLGRWERIQKVKNSVKIIKME
jgi:ribosomal RNA-processing protein 9